jgi:para-aminobenzoate synthetase component 1
VADDMDTDLQSISEMFQQEQETSKAVNISLRTSKSSYLQKVNEVLEHIKRGDIYEVNICQEFYSETAQINPLEVFLQLNKISKPPFSVFLKLNNLFALSASPERYLKKNGKTL